MSALCSKKRVFDSLLISDKTEGKYKRYNNYNILHEIKVLSNIIKRIE